MGGRPASVIPVSSAPLGSSFEGRPFWGVSAGGAAAYRVTRRLLVKTLGVGRRSRLSAEMCRGAIFAAFGCDPSRFQARCYCADRRIWLQYGDGPAICALWFPGGHFAPIWRSAGSGGETGPSWRGSAGDCFGGGRLNSMRARRLCGQRFRLPRDNLGVLFRATCRSRRRRCRCGARFTPAVSGEALTERWAVCLEKSHPSTFQRSTWHPERRQMRGRDPENLASPATRFCELRSRRVIR